MTTIKMIPNSTLSKNKVEAIRRLAHTNMRMILRQMNFKGSDFGDRLVGCCPVPHKSSGSPNDNNKAFSWDFTRQMWQCFSHRCHNIYGADVFALVRAHRNCNFKEAVDWVLKVINKDPDDIQEINSNEAKQLQSFIQKKSELVRHKRMEDDIMRHLTPSKYLLNRGFSQEAISEFRAGGEWHKFGTYGEHRAIVPIYDPLDGYLIAFTCRILDDSKIETWRPKWLHALNFAEMRKKASEKTDADRFYASSVLFNLHRAKEHMGESKTIVITEGPLDVMRLWEAGIKNAVAILGTGFSKQHKMLLHKIGCKRIVCLLDSDDAGQKATSGVEKMCSGYFDYVAVSLPGNKDPGETDPSQLRMFLKDYL
jgi:DNA primase